MVYCRVSAYATHIHQFNFLPIRSESTFGAISTGDCNQTLAIYNDCWNQWNTSCLGTAIHEHQECILKNSSQTLLAAMSAALVLLGFAPILLQLAGPRIGELGLMSVKRPALTVLLAFGVGAVYPSRPFRYYEETLKTIKDLEEAETPMLQVRNKLKDNIILQGIVCGVQYLLAVAAIANTFHTSYMLGVASVSSIESSNSLLLLYWTFTTFIISIPTALSFWLSYKNASWSRIFRGSLTTCFVQEALERNDFKFGWFASFSYLVASLLSLVQVISGVLVFSSLLFILPGDAAIFSLVRYLVSAIMCQAVIAFEMNGMQAAMKAVGQEKVGGL